MAAGDERPAFKFGAAQLAVTTYAMNQTCNENRLVAPEGPMSKGQLKIALKAPSMISLCTCIYMYVYVKYACDSPLKSEMSRCIVVGLNGQQQAAEISFNFFRNLLFTPTTTASRHHG